MSNQQTPITNFPNPNPIQIQSFSRFGLLTAILIILFMGLNNILIVREYQYCVVRQFGEVVRIIDQPGLTFKVPFIQTVDYLPKFQMVYHNQPTEVNTKDKKKMMIDNYVIWKIEDPTQLIQNARTISNAENKLGEAVYSLIRAELGKLNFTEIVNETDANRVNFNDVVTKKVDEVLARDNYGLHVVDVRIKRIELPVQNEQSVYNRMISERKSKAQEYLSIGIAEATKITANTDFEVKKLLADADFKAKQIEAEGEEEAAKIYNRSYGKDPKFYEMYRTLQSYKTTLNNKPVIVMPLDSPFTRYLKGTTLEK